MDHDAAPEPASLLGRLATLPDHRRRQGRQYPLPALLGMCVLAALNGQRSLYGMWEWTARHWATVAPGLGFDAHPKPPVYATIWYVFAALNTAQFEHILRDWTATWAASDDAVWSLDGKVLRGSKRRTDPALGLIGVAAQTLKVVLAQQPILAGDEVGAALAVLRQLPLAGRTITLDAGLLYPQVAQTIVEREGAYLGVVKGNQSDVKQAIDEWVVDQLFSPAGPGGRGGAQRETARAGGATHRGSGGRG